MQRLVVTAAVLWVGVVGGCAPEQVDQPRGEGVAAGVQPDSVSESAPREPSSASADSQSAAASLGVLPPDEPPSEPPPRAGGFEPAENVSRGPEPTGRQEAGGKARVQWGSSGPSPDAAAPWRSLAYDGIHDAESDAVQLLQEPRTALRGMPRANAGNFVDWVAALRGGMIRPRARVGAHGEMQIRETDILFADTRTMPVVIFPHRAHTEWLDCSNCHDRLFKAQRGANQISMTEIARGRACGLCHGKVAFPPTECFRCHSGPRPQG